MKIKKEITKNIFNNPAIHSQEEGALLEKKAQELIQSLSKNFLKEANSSLINMTKILNQSKSLNENERKKILKTEFFQSAHDLKGQGSTYGYPLVSKLAAYICETVLKKRIFKNTTIENLENTINDMKEVLKNPANTKNHLIEKRILNRLEKENV